MYIYLDMLIFILFQLSVFFYGNKVFSYLCSFFIAFETIMMKGKNGVLPPAMPHL